VLGLLAYSAVLCSERGVIVAFGVALIYNIYRMRNRMIGLLVALVLVSGVAYNVDKFVSATFIEQKMTLTDISVKRRIAQWISAIRIFVDKPIFGVGYHYFTNPNRVDKYVTYFEGTSSRGKLIHNSLLDILATSGLVALIPFLTFLVGLFVTLVKVVRRNRGDPFGYFALMALSIFITQQLQNQTAIEVYSEVLNTMTFLIYGAAVGYQRYVKDPEDARILEQGNCELSDDFSAQSRPLVIPASPPER
jgi:O-antigen ligase